MLVFTRYTVALNRLVVRASRKTPHPSWLQSVSIANAKVVKILKITNFHSNLFQK